MNKSFFIKHSRFDTEALEFACKHSSGRIDQSVVIAMSVFFLEVLIAGSKGSSRNQQIASQIVLHGNYRFSDDLV